MAGGITSQNGWPLIAGSGLDNRIVPGTNIRLVPGLKPGDTATVLFKVAELFNKRVAKLYNPGCWGYAAPTPIPGSAIYSNHGSGTAIDLNAPSFPWKLRRMSAAQRAACRQIVKELAPVVQWGGDYTTFVDEMHFEIIGSASQVAKVAQRIKKGGSSDMRIPDKDNYYWRYGQKLALQVRGRQLTRAEFRKWIVGKTDLQAVEILSDHKEADTAQALQNLGKKAAQDNWRGQILTYQDTIKKQQVLIDTLKKQQGGIFEPVVYYKKKG